MSGKAPPKVRKTPRRGTSAQRAATAAGRWPVADPEPHVIIVLRRVLNLLSYEEIPSTKRAEAIREIKGIVDAWDATESISDLRELLGLKRSRGRRRTQRTVNREFAIALAYAEQRRRGTVDPLGATAQEFAVDEREVLRADEKWGPVVAKVLAVVPTAILAIKPTTGNR